MNLLIDIKNDADAENLEWFLSGLQFRKRKVEPEPIRESAVILEGTIKKALRDYKRMTSANIKNENQECA